MSQARLYARRRWRHAVLRRHGGRARDRASTSYAERTQVILTTTAPGKDVLRLPERREPGLRAVSRRRVQAMEMQAYSYESQFVSEEMLVVDGRRGRRPGRRR